MNEPNINVGIMIAPEINFELSGAHTFLGNEVTGRQSVKAIDGKLIWNDEPYDFLLFTPKNADCKVTLRNVVIGIHFHWERFEDQSFKGAMRFIVEKGKVRAINVVNVEDYLTSVISSEMSATSSLELLKAHAVTSRSWLLSQISQKHNACSYEHSEVGSGEMIRWYDRDDHDLFDVCADDHCQRYQGITRQSTEAVVKAIEATRGQVLTYDGELCDARFSKCCGGVFEQFENCWEAVPHPYLKARRDFDHENEFPDLTREDNATEWILKSVPSYCNTTDRHVLTQVMNNYDNETADFYRWTVEYSQDELSKLIAKKLDMDFGRIRSLEPVERGTSGRLFKLRIVGEKQSLTIGKELEIRRALSESHLYSSAFIVERHDIDSEGYPQKFVLRGAGWGHGVGLCQIGAAVMGEKGFGYREILLHYFADAEITNWY